VGLEQLALLVRAELQAVQAVQVSSS